jgi:terminase small subunit-like protein
MHATEVVALRNVSSGKSISAAMTTRQRRFVEEFLIDLNATQATIRAGYSARAANEQSARGC